MTRTEARTDVEPGFLVPQNRLNQPWRALVAVVELVLAGLAVWLSFRLWADVVTVIPMPDGDGGHVDLTHHDGGLVAAAIALGLAAALLVVDAVRQLLLALRVRPRRRAAADEEPWPSFDQDD